MKAEKGYIYEIPYTALAPRQNDEESNEKGHEF